jgi:hypothetical protein
VADLKALRTYEGLADGKSIDFVTPAVLDGVPELAAHAARTRAALAAAGVTD